MKNVAKRVLVGFALATLSLLSACSGGISAAPYAFDVAIDPNPLGYEVTGGVYDIPEHTLTFNSKAGSVGATIEGWEAEFFDASGAPLFPGDPVQRSRGSLNVRVPPGILCPGSGGEEGEEDGGGAAAPLDCTINTTGVVFARGASASSAGTVLLPGDIAIQHYELLTIGGAVGAYAEITFYGTDDLQREFISEPYQFAITVPVNQ